jgi:hypothetical protein
VVAGETLPERVANGPIAIDEIGPGSAHVLYAPKSSHDDSRELSPASRKSTHSSFGDRGLRHKTIRIE